MLIARWSIPFTVERIAWSSSQIQSQDCQLQQNVKWHIISDPKRNQMKREEHFKALLYLKNMTAVVFARKLEQIPAHIERYYIISSLHSPTHEHTRSCKCQWWYCSPLQSNEATYFHQTNKSPAVTNIR